MILGQQVEMAPDAAQLKRGGSPVIGPVILTRRPCPMDWTDTDVIVCGRKDATQSRVSPIPPPPPADGLLSRPLMPATRTRRVFRVSTGWWFRFAHGIWSRQEDG
jgi:hypothetical protein